MASISAAKERTYPEVLLQRRAGIAGDYRQSLLLLEADLIHGKTERFEIHRSHAAELFKRLTACQKTLSALWNGIPPALVELPEIDRLQQRLTRTIKARQENLRQHLKKSTLSRRPRRTFDHDVALIDISA